MERDFVFLNYSVVEASLSLTKDNNIVNQSYHQLRKIKQNHYCIIAGQSFQDAIEL